MPVSVRYPAFRCETASMILRRDRELARAALLLVLVYLAGVGAVTWRPSGGEVATWWPAAGFSAALLLLGPRRHWGWYAAGIAVVSALANLTGGRDLDVSAMFGVANAAEAVVVATSLRKPGQRHVVLSSPEDFFGLVRACALGAATIAAGAAAAVALDGGDAAVAARTTFPTHLAATLVILPMVLLRRTGVRRHRLGELAAQAVVLVAT